MSVLDVIRKGFGFLLMSMGVSSPKAKVLPESETVDLEKKSGNRE